MHHHRRGLILSALAIALAGTAQAQDRRRPRRRRRGEQDDDIPRRSDAPHTTISTGRDPLQAYDLYRSARSDGPILAYIHGGGWRRGDKGIVHLLPEYADRHGLTLASIGYRFVPEVTPREQAQDVAAAIADLIRTHPGRPIFLLGHSAGAHLAALVGVDETYLGAHRIHPAELGGVILLDGAGYDATLPRPPGRIGEALGDLYEEAFGDQATELSPTLLVRSGERYPPYLIFYVASRQDSRGQSEGLAQALNRAGGRAVVVADPDDNHGGINAGFGQAGDPEGERADRFIRRRR